MVCGDHFGLIVDRRSPEVLLGKEPWGDSRAGGVAGVVDAAIARGDRRQAVDFLSLEASHGRVNRATGKEGCANERMCNRLQYFCFVFCFRERNILWWLLHSYMFFFLSFHIFLRD